MLRMLAKIPLKITKEDVMNKFKEYVFNKMNRNNYRNVGTFIADT